jgi:glycosyltransferase involved in cell wall biosynthesis
VLISCIMPTRARAAWVQRAVDCFLAQTWADRELVILDDRDAPSFATVPEGPGIRYELASRRLSIGAKRNLCCSRASGEIIAHWDDDDYSCPGRLADQLSRLVESGKSVTGYCDMIFADPTGHRWLWGGGNGKVIGSSLMFMREFWRANLFPDQQLCEDGAFARRAHVLNQLSCAPAGDLMICSIHPGNTSRRDLSRPPWRTL